MASLPIIDFSLLDGSPHENRQFLDRLRAATHDVGFFYLVGHGVPEPLWLRMFDSARAFFALPEDQKLAIENVRSPHFRGYTRTGGERTLGRVDWREQIDIGAERPAAPVAEGVEDYWILEGPNLWPTQLPQLRVDAEEWMALLAVISTRLLRAWAECLGASPDIFNAAFATNPSPNMKIVRYPGVDSAGSWQGVGAHKDLGILTLLAVESGKGGLQVEKEGEWIDAPPLESAFVVNIGELLEIATNGYLKATNHRVLSPKAGTERISIPYFHGPALDAVIPTIDLPAELAAEAPGVSTDPNNLLHPVFGRNWLKSRLRAHPNVVEAQHPYLLTRR